MGENSVIFDLTNEKWNYKGVLFAEADNSAMDDGCMAIPQRYAPGIMSIIWVDDNGYWHHKTRLKYPQSGNKQIFSKSYKKEQQQGVKVNETYVLSDIYKFPMINKIWTPNPSGDGMGIVEIMKKLDMIESIRIEMMDEKDKT